MTLVKKTTLLRSILLASLPLALAASCGIDDSYQANDEKAERWNGANDPQNMGRNYIYEWDDLKTDELKTGASEIVPWVDTYWPMKEDGYNDRWQSGKLSPMELYDKAFNDWTPSMGFEEFLKLEKFSSPGRAYDGEYYQEYGPAAEWAHKGGNQRARVLTDPDGTAKWDEESDDVNAHWGGLEGWFGHCHAWAPASYMYPEPLHSVTYEGETFEVADIKALAEATFEGGRSMFLGGRCNTKEVERDDHGRIIDRECRDTNAGAFHVVLLNRMGIRKNSFVSDVTYDYQVWNHPARDYTITLQEEVDLTKALELVNRTDVTEYPYSDAKRFVHVKIDFRYVVEGSASTTPYAEQVDRFTRTARYDYLLELESDSSIIGGEWIDDQPHPDFIWAPYGANDVRKGWGSGVIIEKEDVQKLVDLSRENEQPIEGTPYDSAPASDIPDNDAAGVSDTISIPDSTTIEGLQVMVNISHTYRGDLSVELVRDERRVTLIAHDGGSEDDIVKTFSVDTFDGDDAAGDWTLQVTDNARFDKGTLNSWSLIVGK